MNGDAVNERGGAVPVVDRVAAFAQPPDRVPRKAVYWALVAVVALGGGGILLEHVFTSAGLNAYSVTASSASTTGRAAAPALRSGTAAQSHPAADAGRLGAFMGIARLTGIAAPPFTLTDRSGTRTSIAALRGRVVVLAFFDAACDDVCPVLGSEIVRAEQALGPARHRVAFVAVNTDPLALSVGETVRTSAALGLARYANWYFLTGSLGALDPVWAHYGISIDVAVSSGRVAHNDLLYFIDRSGREVMTATPFADEAAGRRATLARSAIDRFGDAIAIYAEQLLR